MNDPTVPIRATLREAIASRAAARATHEAAEQALIRADDVIMELTADAERHASASATAESARADEVAAAIRKGGKPSITLSKALSDARHAEADTKAKYALAQGARARLAAELTEAEAALATANNAVLAAAIAVAAGEAVAFIDQMHASMSKLFATFDTITSIEHIGIALPRSARMPPFPPRLQQALFDCAARAPGIEMLRGPQLISSGPHAVAAEKWRTYLSMLATDPDATLADVGDPALPRAVVPVLQAGPIVREQPWISDNSLSDALLAPHATLA